MPLIRRPQPSIPLQRRERQSNACDDKRARAPGLCPHKSHPNKIVVKGDKL